MIIHFADLTANDLSRAGGKAVALGRLASAGLPVPSGVCITTDIYQQYLDSTGLRLRLLLLERKPFSEMRWAGGIVERRGGMLIHGAIIAREYCIPCVTGVPEATQLIRTGDLLTVDGFLGLVIISAAHLRGESHD